MTSSSCHHLQVRDQPFHLPYNQTPSSACILHILPSCPLDQTSLLPQPPSAHILHILHACHIPCLDPSLPLLHSAFSYQQILPSCHIPVLNQSCPPQQHLSASSIVACLPSCCIPGLYPSQPLLNSAFCCHILPSCYPPVLYPSPRAVPNSSFPCLGHSPDLVPDSLLSSPLP